MEANNICLSLHVNSLKGGILAWGGNLIRRIHKCTYTSKKRAHTCVNMRATCVDCLPLARAQNISRKLLLARSVNPDVSRQHTRCASKPNLPRNVVTCTKVLRRTFAWFQKFRAWAISASNPVSVAQRVGSQAIGRDKAATAGSPGPMDVSSRLH